MFLLIRKGCAIGSNVCIVYMIMTIYMETMVLKVGYTLGKVIIAGNCWIGAGTIISRETHIRKNSVTAAGTVVKGEYPENSMSYNDKKTLIKKLD